MLRPRHALRQALRALPSRPLRFAIYRRLVGVNYAPAPELRFKVATTQAELAAAFRLLHDEYVRSGYMDPHPSGMRITPYHALPSTSTLVATWGDEVVGTLSIIRDGDFGLPLAQIFDVGHLRGKGMRLAEISSLAVKESFRHRRGEILFPLLKFMYQYCIRYFGVDYLLIAVNPRTIEFYEALLFFQRLAERTVDRYDFVNGAPAVGAYLDLREAYRRFAVAYGGQPAQRDLFHYFIISELAALQFPDRTYFKISDPVMTPAMLGWFFREQSDVFARLDARRAEALRLVYPRPAYAAVLPPPDPGQSQSPARPPRFDVRCSARLIAGPQRVVRMTVDNVSRTGLCGELEGRVRFGERVRINVAVADFEIADLEGWPVWTNMSGRFGFHIERACDHWHRFIGHLEQERFAGASAS